MDSQPAFQATLGQLQAMTGAELIGDPNVVVSAIVHPAKVSKPTDMALILDKGILPLVETLTLTTAIVPSDIDLPNIPNQLRVSRPKVLLAQLLSFITPQPYVNDGVHASAVIDPSVTLGDAVQIGPFCSVGPNTRIGKGSRLIGHVTVGANVTIGEDTLLYAGVRIGDRVRVGSRVIMHPNAVIGADGFSFVTPEESSMESAMKRRAITSFNHTIIKVPSAGTVVIGDDVEIGANACVDRASMGDTVIGNHSKIDNLVQVGHNVVMGENCMVAGLVGIAGSVKIGDRVVIAGHAGIKDNISIGDDAIIMPMSGVSGSVPERTILVGGPGVPMKEFLYREMFIKRLIRGLPKTLDDMKARLDQLEGVSSVEPKVPEAVS